VTEQVPVTAAARRRVWTWVAAVIVAAIVIGAIVGTVWSATRSDGGPGSGSSPTVTSTPPPSVPQPLQAPFDRLQHAVQP
jgi:hypothetical protein